MGSRATLGLLTAGRSDLTEKNITWGPRSSPPGFRNTTCLEGSGPPLVAYISGTVNQATSDTVPHG